jgi:hypothetical protein
MDESAFFMIEYCWKISTHRRRSQTFKAPCHNRSTYDVDGIVKLQPRIINHTCNHVDSGEKQGKYLGLIIIITPKLG